MDCKLVNGKPRSPWVQGLVERTNACVEDMIAAKRADLKTNDWVAWLPEIQCKFIPTKLLLLGSVGRYVRMKL